MDGSFAGLGVLDQLNNLGEHGIAANFGGFKDQPAVFVQGGAVKRGAGAFFHRQRLSGQHGLIHTGTALKHRAVHGDFFTRADHNHIPDDNIFGWDFRFHAGADDGSHLWLQIEQLANGFAGAAFGARFQELTQAHERDDDR